MRIFLLFLFSVSIPTYGFSQEVSYQRVLMADTASTAAESIVRATDGGFAIAGEIAVDGNAESFLSKFDAEGNQVWSKTYFDQQSHLQMNGVNDTEIFCNQYLKYLIATSDGGFLLGGGIDSSVSITYSNGVTSTSDYNRIYVIRTDSVGNELWAHKFGSNELDWSDAAVQEFSTGNFVIAGSVNQAGFVSRDDLFLKLDSSGNVLTSQSYGGSFDEGVSAIIETGDGHFILCGTSESFSNNQDIYIVKMDGSGNVSWSKHYGSTGFDYGKSVLPAHDGGFYFYGNAGATNPSYISLFKTDSSGTVQWANTYAGYPLDGPAGLFKLADGNFAAVVYHYTSGYNSTIVEIDSNGNYITNADYGSSAIDNNDFLTGVLADGANNLLCGSTNSFSGSQFINQVYLIRTHDNLQSDCNTDVLNFSPTSLALTDGDAATTSAAVSIADYPMLVTQVESILTDDTLCISVYTSDQSLSSTPPTVHLFPNPAVDDVTIQIKDPSFIGGLLMVFDVTGRIILQTKIDDATVHLDVKNFPDGIYALRIENTQGDFLQQAKLIVSH